MPWTEILQQQQQNVKKQAAHRKALKIVTYTRWGTAPWAAALAAAAAATVGMLGKMGYW